MSMRNKRITIYLVNVHYDQLRSLNYVIDNRAWSNSIRI